MSTSSLPSLRLSSSMATCLSLLLLASLGTGSRSLRAGEWPTFRHDNSRSGATRESLKTPLELRWVYTSAAAPRSAWSGPEGRTIEGKELRNRVDFDAAAGVVSAGGRVIFASSVDHQVHCIRLEDGKELWSFFTDGPVRLAPTIHAGRVYFGSDDGNAYCVELVDGALVWKKRAGPADEWLLARGEMISRWPVRTGVLVDSGTAYFGSGIFPHEDVQLHAVAAEDGATVWKRDDISATDAGRNDLSPQGYLLANAEHLFVPSGRSLPAAFDRKSGAFGHKRTFGWRRDAGGVVGGSEAVLADGQVFTMGADHILALDQTTGNIGHGWFAGRRMAVTGETACIATGKEVVRLHREVYSVASRRRHALELQVSDDSSKLRKLSSSEKEEDKTKADELRERLVKAKAEIEELSRRGYLWWAPCELDSEIVVAGDLVIAAGAGRLSLFRATTGEKVADLEVEGDARHLAVADGCLLASTTTGRIYCFATKRSADDDHASDVIQANAPVEESPFPNDALSARYAETAESILSASGVQRGFCLVVGTQEGRLAQALARRSELKIYVVDADAEKVAAARRTLSSAGLYGHRVTVHQGGSESSLPYSNYFANLIVANELVTSGRLDGSPQALVRHLKPCGGVLVLAREMDTPRRARALEALRSEVDRLALGEQSTLEESAPWILLRRGALPGAGGWSHQYGEPGNTACSDDQLIKGGLGVLWYGDPGPGKMVNRHEGAVGPVALNGRIFIQGEDSLMAYDTYNGVFLWESENPEALRTGVFRNENAANLVAGDDSVFYLLGAHCLELDAATGERKAAHPLPPSKDPAKYDWGYLAYRDGTLFGTATIRKWLEERLIRRGKKTEDATDAIFAIDTASEKLLWTYRGKSIQAQTIAVGRDRVFFIDSSVTSEEREAILRQDKSELERLSGEARELAEARLKQADVRLAVAVDAKTGETRWSTPVDVTDCSEIGTGGGKLTVMYKDDTLILCGANANGHYWKQFVEGEFKRRRLVALSAATGYKLWAKDANYRHRPIIVGDRVLAEPWAFDLKSGEQIKRGHPLTGADVPWSMVRPGHHCGMISATRNMLLFRSGYTGFYDLDSDAGTRHFAGHRLGCWINAIPANGLVLIPEASAGCVCLFSIAATIALEPRQPRRPWTIYSAVGPVLPVKHMALNFGAPGDRRDSKGMLWLAYPRPTTPKETSLDLAFDVELTPRDTGTLPRPPAVDETGEEDGWIFASGARRLGRCSIPLLREDDQPGSYAVKLYLVVSQNGSLTGSVPCDLLVQGTLAIEDLAAAAGGDGRTALVLELSDLPVTRDLVVEVRPRAEGSAPDASINLSALTLARTDAGDELKGF